MPIIARAGIALESFSFGEAEEVYPEILGAVVPAEMFDEVGRSLREFRESVARKR